MQQREEAIVAREESVRAREGAAEGGLREISDERARLTKEIAKLDMLRVINDYY